jgi:DNA-binding MarR family transcriptional regulator
MSNSLATKQYKRPVSQSRALGVPKDALDHGLLPTLLGYQLRLAQLAVFRDFEASVGALGISPGRVGVLVLVDANPGLAQSRLAEAVDLDRSTLVPLLDRFEAEGLLERRAGPDRRTNGLWLTATGRRYLTRVKKQVLEHEARILAPLDASEQRVLADLLARIANATRQARD